MKVGEETICYQHQQAQDILEKLLKKYSSRNANHELPKELKKVFYWITKANDSAIRMENKLKWYKEHDNHS